MSRCSHCGVEILDDTEHCPLCHNVLENTGRGRMTYPNVLHKIKKINFLFRLFLFLAIILAVTVVAANFVYHPETWWSVIFIAAEVYGIIMLYLFTKDTGYRIRIIVGIFGFLLFDILADRITGYAGWSVNYMFPTAILLANLAVLLLMLINRRNWQSYLLFQLGVVLFGLAGVLFVFLGWITSPVLSEIACSISILVFLGMVILGGRTARSELKRRFHI